MLVGFWEGFGAMLAPRATKTPLKMHATLVGVLTLLSRTVTGVLVRATVCVRSASSLQNSDSGGGSGWDGGQSDPYFIVVRAHPVKLACVMPAHPSASSGLAGKWSSSWAQHGRSHDEHHQHRLD